MADQPDPQARGEMIDIDALRFVDIFDLEEIQEIQDSFAAATGVASIITDTEGVPITEPSNFCRMCQLVRATDLGRANCYKSDAELGKPNPEGPSLQPCLSGGLWDGGVSIYLGERHIANWLIGQVLTGDDEVEKVLAYGEKIGADADEFRDAVSEVTRMPYEQFKEVGRALFVFAQQLSRMALQNALQEQEITRRERFTTRLNTAADIAGQVASILDPDELLQAVIPLIKERFGLYYVHVYTLDEDEDVLNLRAGYGEPGRMMVEQGHSIPLDREASLVATAARMKAPVLVNDVSENPNFMPNELLPHTKSEVAVPAIAGGKVLGVFDVQHDEVDYFTDADLDVFTTLAAQIATALQNAQTVERLNLTQASVDRAGDAVFWIDEDATFAYVNDTTCERLGYTQEELLGKTIFDIDPVFPKEAWPGHWEALQENQTMTIETVHEAKDGTRIPVEVSLNYIEYGDVAYNSAYARDITERLEAEQAIRESEERLRLMVQGVRDYAIITLDPDGNVASWNEGAQRIKGYTEDEIIGEHYSRFYTEEDRESGHTAEVLAMATEKGSYEDRGLRVRKDGSTFWADVVVTAIRDEDGSLRGFSKVTRDITEQREAQEALQQANLVIEDSPVMLFRWRADEDWPVEFVSQNVERVLGYTPEELTSGATPYPSIVHPDDLGRVVEEVAAHTESGVESFVQEYRILDKDGGVRWTSDNTFIIRDNAGQVTHYQGTVQDVTEQHEAEESIRQSEQRLSEALTIAQMAYWEFDVSTQKFAFNDQYYRTFHNTTAEEVGGYQVSAEDFAQRFVSPEDAPSVARNVQMALETTDPDFQLRDEARNLTLDGDEIWASIWLTIEKDTEGRTVKLRGVNQVITDRKLAEIERERFAAQLSTASQISEQVNAILDPDELLNTVIPLLKERFDLYYAHVYVLEGDTLNLRAGYGEPGRIMVERGHSIPLEREASLVATAARTKDLVHVPDVTENPNFLPNPLLPDTKTEVAVPLVVGNQVLGVFDIQHDVPNTFTQAYLDVFTTLAGQIATALQNAQFVGQVEQNLRRTEVRLAVSQALAGAKIEQQVWETLLAQSGLYPQAAVGLYTIVEEEGELIMVTQAFNVFETEMETEPVGTRFPAKEFEAVAYTLTGETFVSQNVLTDERMGSGMREDAEKLGYLSLAGMPMMQGNTIIGIIMAHSPVEGYFDEVKLNLYATLAEQGAVALQTARLRSETERQRALYNGILQNLPIGVWAVDNEFTPLHVNEAGQAMLGREMLEADGTRYTETYDVIHVESGEPYANTELPLFKAVTQGGQHTALDAGVRHPDGTVVPMLINAAPLSDPRGEQMGAVVVFSDMTEQRRAQQAIAQSEAQQRAILETTPVGIAITRASDNTVAYLNPEFTDILGYTEEELLGKSVPDFYYDEAEAQAAFELMMAQDGVLEDHEIHARRADDTPLWLSLSIKPIMYGEQPAMLAAFVDITDRKRAEAERERFTTRLNTAAQISEQVGSILDPDELLQAVIPLIKEEFGLYYVHVYTLDEDEGVLNLRAGYGEAGETMLAESHSIPLDREASLVATAARTQEPVLVDDVTENPNFMPNPLLPDTKTEVAVPSIAGGRVLGVFDVQHDETHYFTDADLDVFQTLAAQIANAFRSASLYGQVEQSLAQTQTRLRVSQTLAEAQTEEEVLDAMLEVADFYPESGTFLYMVDPEVEELTMVSVRNSPIKGGVQPLVPVGTRFPASQFPMLQHITPSTLWVTPNMQTDERADPASRQIAEQTGIVSLSILPITAGSEWLGVIVAISTLEDYYDADKLYLYQSLAEQSAVALRIARLRDNVQRSLEETEVRLRVSQALAGAQTEDEILDVLVEQAGLYPDAQVTLQLIDLEAEELTTEVARTALFDSGLAAPPVGTRFTKEMLPALQYLSSDQDFVVNDVLEDERIDPQSRAYLEEMGVGGGANIRIGVGDMWLGILTINTKQKNYFDEAKLNLYRTLADQGAIALQAARLRDRLTENEERLSLALESGRVGIWEFWPQRDEVYFNPTYYTMLGYEPYELPQELSTWAELMHPEDAPHANEIVMASIETGEDFHLQFRMKTKEGGLRWIQAHGYATELAPEGAAERVIGTHTDITEQKQAEVELLESQQKFQTVADFTYDWEYWLGPEDEFLYVSPACEKITGYTVEEFMENPHLLDEIVLPEDRDLLHQHVHDYHDNPETRDTAQQAAEVNFRIRTKDGEVRWIGHACQAVYGPDGQWLGRRASNRDATEAVEAQRRVQESQRLLQEFLDNFPDLAFAKDTDGAIILANRALYQFFPTDDGELLGKTVYDLVPEEVADGIWQSELAVLEKGETTEFEEVVPQQGEMHTKLTTKFPLYDAEGNVMALGGVSVDITDRKQAEAERERFTTRLNTAAQISEQVGSILDPDELLQAVIPLIKEEFGLYYVHVYTLDEETGLLNLRAGYGEAGEKMLAEGHSIPLDREASLVATAARTQEPVLVDDVTENPNFMPNPLLPDTKTEVAVPAIAGGQVLGVFDVQHDEAHYFTQADLDVFQTLAAQIANAFRSAEIVEELNLTQFSVDHGPAAIYLMRQDGTLYDVNETACQMLGYTREELLALDSFTDLDPNFPPEAWAVHWEELKEQHEMTIQTQHRAKDGQLIPVEVEVNYLKYGDLELDCGFARDITDRLEAERAIRESEERLRLLIEGVQDYAIVMLDPEGYVTSWNEGAQRIKGYTEAEIIGKHYSRFYTEEDRESGHTAEVLEQAKKQGSYEDTGLRVRKDGSTFWADVVITALRDDQGNLRGFSKVTRDITERREREAALQESEQRFRGLYESSPLGIILNDFESGDYLEANEAFLEMVGYSLDELNELSYWDLTPETYAEQEEAQVRSMENTGEYGPYEKEYIKSDGTVLPVTLNGVLIEGGTGRKLIWSTVEDITVRKQAEAERARLATIISNASDFIGYLDLDANAAAYVNEAGRQMMGHSQMEEVLGQPITHFHPPEDVERMQETIIPIVLEKGEWRGENRLLRVDGSVIPVDQTLFLIQDEHQDRRLLATFMTDITERLEAEAERARLSAVLEATTDFVGIATPDGQGLYFNRAALDMMGLPPDANPADYNITMFSSESELERTTQEILPAATQNGIWSGESSLRTLDGREIPVLMTIIALKDDQGNLRYLANVSRDITDLREAERQRQRFTTQLSTAAEISQSVGAILDTDELLSTVIPLLKDRFGLYHTHVYVVDEANGALRLRAGYGQVGEIMKRQGHKIMLDNERSLVARAAQTRDVVLSNDVTQDPSFMPNLLLPETQAEVAVPFMIGDQVLGVFDVQADEANFFTESDLNVFRTLAGQIANAFQSARLFEQQREAELAQREAAERIRAIFEAMTEGITVTNTLGQIEDVNEATLRLHGYDVRDELLGRSQMELFARTNWSQASRGIRKALETGRSETAEYVMQRSDGSTFDAEQNSALLRDAEGSPAGFVSITRDITQRKAAQETQQRLTTILESTNDMVSISDPEGNLVYMNRAGKLMKGWPPDEDITQHTIDDFHPQWVYDLIEENGIPTAIEEGIWSGETALLHEDGHEIPTLQTIMSHKSSRGEVLYLSTIIRDITDIQQAAEERERFTNQLRTAADVSAQVTTILDQEELLDLVVPLISERFALYHVHVYTLDEEQGAMVMRVGTGEAGRKMREEGHTIPLGQEHSLVAQAARARSTVLVEDVDQSPDFLPNALLPDTKSEVAIPLIVGDRLVGVLDVQDDEPDRFTEGDINVFTTLAGQVAVALENARFFEEIQQTAERLRELDRLKSEFLANMSHELRTPLNSILGYTEVLLMGIDGELTPDMEEDVKAIYENGGQLLRLINDILDLTKIEAGRMTLSMEPVDVASLLEDVKVNNMGLLHKRKTDVDIVISVDDDLPIITADRVRLAQVLNNLVSNAVKFTEEGYVYMRASNLEGERVRIQVEDTGMGIAEEDIEKIFERFRQVDGSSTRRAEGTGLGLAITQRLVEMHGGTIEVSSVLGEGSTFTVVLPIAQSEKPAAVDELQIG